LDPENPALYSSLGGIYFLEGKYLTAAELFHQSIGNQPTPQAYANAGTLYYFGGSYAQARAMFERAAALSPGDYRYHAFLGESILSAEDGGLEAARPHFEQAIELAHATLDINPEDHLVRAAMASYLATLGDQAAARKELTRLATIEHADMETLHAMGLTHLALGQTALARADFEAAIGAGYPRKLLHDDPRTRPLFEQQPADSAADSAQFPPPTTRQPS
ncbi:MAG TPA: tetratricopeptide repeat protein, partial [Wenzhouxiangella sp.]|nr:tetratricopeptide repeat protein [Wenzhouxiangella sp.]